VELLHHFPPFLLSATTVCDGYPDESAALMTEIAHSLVMFMYDSNVVQNSLLFFYCFIIFTQ
jgi:hypothetical protein